jgi:small GTP-binding protein
VEKVTFGGSGTPLTRETGGGAALSLAGTEYEVEQHLPEVKANIWDVGGQEKIRPLWRHYVDETKLLLFVADAAAPDRLKEAAAELKVLLNAFDASDMSGVPVLLVASKQDLAGALSAQEVAQEMGLDTMLADRMWYALGVSVLEGTGLNELRDWIAAVTAGLEDLPRSGMPEAGRMVKSANKA